MSISGIPEAKEYARSIQRKREAKVLRLMDGDVIVVKRYPDTTEDDMKRITDVLQNALQTQGAVYCIFVNRMSDIKVLTEQQMKNYGWIRNQETE